MTGTFEADYKFGKFEFHNSTNPEDRKEGIDGWIGNMPAATRKFRCNLNTFRQISIRKRKWHKSEFDKILNGEYKPVLYLYEYIDAYVICKVEDIANCLKTKLFTERPNKDNSTIGCYIDLGLLPSLVILKPNKGSD